MESFASKLAYLLTSARRSVTGRGSACPNCGAPAASVVDRKYLVTRLARCSGCRLLYRAPTTAREDSEAFYQSDYAEGFTTDTPGDETLRCYMEAGFPAEKDYGRYIEVVDAAQSTRGRRLFDYGCSWGYGSYQFRRHGFDVEAFEISRPRAAYAREKLGVAVHESLASVRAGFDVFFCSHVLEHLPAVQEAIDFAFKILVPDGVFVAVTPNGASAFRQREPAAWHRAWGFVHPNFLDPDFYALTFRERPYLITSDPYTPEEIAAWRASGQQVIGDTGRGSELLVLAQNA
ncbi:class I SAM-dependent methyltransferase [Ramlibacter sp. PS4R-6]|uniref:class I SAM-dependent methyltransferase n=1 Tax=Ramlibacter sp. PS4R-6 TaxID=3133438 RepID=UPI0030A3F02C